MPPGFLLVPTRLHQNGCDGLLKIPVLLFLTLLISSSASMALSSQLRAASGWVMLNQSYITRATINSWMSRLSKCNVVRDIPAGTRISIL